ncbi:MAG: hypothetical protein ABI354_02215, partial [Candidatus Saccharimonadales bacterium]
MRLLSSPGHKAEVKRLAAINEEKLQSRLEQGDPTLRRTILGKIRHRKAGGWVVKSRELPRYAYTENPLPRLANVPLELLDSYVNHPLFMPTPEADNRAIATLP